MEYKIKIPHELTFTRAQVVAALAFLGVCVYPIIAGSETYVMEAYYPSPVGVYTNMTVTSNAVLARDGGTVGIGGDPTTTAKLEVKGNVNISGVVVSGSFAADPTASDQKIEGAIYFNTTSKKHKVFQNSAWSNLGGGATIDYSVCEIKYHSENTGCLPGQGAWGTCSNGYVMVAATTGLRYPEQCVSARVKCCKLN